MKDIFDKLKETEPIVLWYYAKKFIIAFLVALILVQIFDRIIPSNYNKTEVFVAKEDITIGTTLNSKMFEKRDIDIDAVPDSKITDSNDFVYKKNVISIFKNQVLTPNLLATDSQSYLEINKVAISLNISNTSKANQFLTGDKINLMTTNEMGKAVYLSLNSKVLPNTRDAENENNYLIEVSKEEAEKITTYLNKEPIIGILIKGTNGS